MHGKFQNDENLVTFSSFLLSLHIHILELLDGPENSSGDVGRVVKVDSGKFPHRPGFDLGADPVVHDGSAGNDQAQGNDHVADVHPRNSGEDRGGGVVRDCSRGGLSSTIFGVVVDHVVLRIVGRGVDRRGVPGHWNGSLSSLCLLRGRHGGGGEWQFGLFRWGRTAPIFGRVHR